ncbi:DUF1045 domain-containing protein [Microvirga sp. VF16]|uniref:DUF1045 domain-containing protein n=1 Tax=Microvirga sp. VF16 TaxID=2807101 RepID=UPI00193E41E1|nr:DUF1045 domain-containing protein [Microvirga sp. VF16]QRM32365.1 DUF1045 domain-containing protein [Microvirga sp. VF16]
MRNAEQSDPGPVATVSLCQSGEPRYAIYYSPPAEHPLTQAAEAWLGRSAFRSNDDVPIRIEDEIKFATSEPRRYGFHATLKPPFRLAKGRKVEELEQALSRFAKDRGPCPLGRLQLSVMRGFFALVPMDPIPRLQAFASSIVETFDPFRAPFNEAELQRRLTDRLDDAETTYLVRWGYPYVFDCFRFHMTLTNRIAPDRQADVRARLQKRFGALLAEDYRIDALTLFEQARPDADFVVRARFAIGQGTVT